MTSVSLMHEAGHPKPVLWNNLEGSVGREVRGRFRIGGTRIHLWLIMLMYGKNHHNIIIILN